MWQLYTFLAILSPLWGWFNVWLIRTIYVAQRGDYYGKQWHFWQLILHAFVVFYVCSNGWHTLSLWTVFLLWCAYDYLIYPGIINLFALRQWEKRGFFYTGKKDRVDKEPDFLQGWLLKKNKPELWLACIKLSFLAAAIALNFFL